MLALNAPTNPYLSCGDAKPLLSILLLPRGLVGSDGGWVGVGGGRDPLKSERKGRSVGQVDPFSSVRAYAPISGVGKNGRGGWWVITGSPPAAGTGLMQLLPHFSVSTGDRSFPLRASGEARGKCAHSYAL